MESASCWNPCNKPTFQPNQIAAHHRDLSDLKATEEYLAAEISKISFKERLEALDDVHCVGEEIETTPEALKRILKEFDDEVKKNNNSTYKLAVSKNRAYVEDTTFRLRFLCCKMYNVKQAVQQMFAFLRQKALYFGEESLGRDILLSDLNDEDLEFIRSPVYHVPIHRDRKGRVIAFMLGSAICVGDELLNPLVRSSNTMLS